MKAWTSAFAALALAACTPPADKGPAPPQAAAIEAPSGQYTLDPVHSTVTVRALHFGLVHYTLRFNTVSGVLNFNAADPTQSTVEASVATNSLDTPFGGARDFDAELQNSEWLAADDNPAATFRSTSVTLTGANTGQVTGDLTIRGVTHPVTLDVTFNAGYQQHPMGAAVSLVGFSAHGVVKRSEYGMNVLQPTAGLNNGVSDDVELIIEAEFNRPIEQAPPSSTTTDPVN